MLQFGAAGDVWFRGQQQLDSSSSQFGSAVSSLQQPAGIAPETRPIVFMPDLFISMLGQLFLENGSSLRSAPAAASAPDSAAPCQQPCQLCMHAVTAAVEVGHLSCLYLTG
jgi:hypothetical protein